MKKWRFIGIVLNLLMVHVIAAEPAAILWSKRQGPEERTGRIMKKQESMKIEIGASVVVSMAPPGEMRWGFWSFPYLFRMPDGALALTHHIDHDTEEAYGKAAPLFISRDVGRSWTQIPPLVAHTIFRHIDAEGRPRKAIVVREVRVGL